MSFFSSQLFSRRAVVMVVKNGFSIQPVLLYNVFLENGVFREALAACLPDLGRKKSLGISLAKLQSIDFFFLFRNNEQSFINIIIMARLELLGVQRGCLRNPPGRPAGLQLTVRFSQKLVGCCVINEAKCILLCCFRQKRELLASSSHPCYI